MVDTPFKKDDAGFQDNDVFWDTTSLSVTTGSATDTNTQGFSLTGTIADTGKSAVTRRGFCYKAGTSGDPTTSDSVSYTNGNFAPGQYSATINGLLEKTSYRVRAYAINGEGTAYGSSITVLTLTHNTVTTSAIYGYIETGDFVLGNRSIEKIIEECFPDLAYQTQTNSFYIQVGTRQNLSLALSWSPAVAFKIGQDQYSDLRNYTSLGAYLRLRFYTNIVQSPWSLGSFNFNYSQGRKVR